MGKAKRSGKTKAPKKDPLTVSSGKKASKQTGGRKTGKQSPAPSTVSSLEDRSIAPVAGIPDEAQIDEIADGLSPEDRRVFQRMRKLLAEHLGSDAAALVWLVSPGAGFETTPLDAIRKGQAKMVLGTLESQWGSSPIYA